MGSARRAELEKAMVSAKEFHPMRGHVIDWQKVQFGDCVLVLRNVMRGWVFTNEDGAVVSETMAGANDVLADVQRRIQARAQ